MSLYKENEEVYYSRSPFRSLSAENVRFLKARAAENVRNRCRICTHASPQDKIHEMFILHRRGNYVPPHCHLHSDESALILEGEGAMLFFNGQGQISDTIYLNADPVLGVNYLRTPSGTMHSLFIASENLLFKETVGGPFLPGNSRTADWSVDESDLSRVADFLALSQQHFLAARENHNVNQL